MPTRLPTHRSEIFDFLKDYTDSGKVAGEHSQHSTSAESNKPVEAGLKKPLLPIDEANYLRMYGRELFEDMLQNEYKS